MFIQNLSISYGWWKKYILVLSLSPLLLPSPPPPKILTRQRDQGREDGKIRRRIIEKRGGRNEIGTKFSLLLRATYETSGMILADAFIRKRSVLFFDFLSKAEHADAEEDRHWRTLTSLYYLPCVLGLETRTCFGRWNPTAQVER